MIWNYFLIAQRILRRQLGYSLINIIGLAVGICCFALVMRYVYEEFSYDRFHPYGDRTYRLIRETQIQGRGAKFSIGIDGPLAVVIKEEIPEIEKAVRIYSRHCWMRSEGELFIARFVHTEEGFLDLFSFSLKKGAVESLRQVQNGVLITESTARKFFGNENPVGKVISSEWKYIAGDYTVVGVVQDPAQNTEVTFDILTVTEHQGFRMQQVWAKWRPQSGFHPIHAFMLLHKDADLGAIEAKIAAIVKDRYDADYASKNRIHLQPVHRMHLYSHIDYGMRSGGDIMYVYLMAAGGIFILLVACINYVNLVTARSATRALEVGLRKVVGAHRAQIIRQFISESLIFIGIATVLGVGLGELVKPYAAIFLGRSLFSEFDAAAFWTIILLGVLLLGCIAGFYPALFLSRYQPAVVVKGQVATDSRGILRKGLVVCQFLLSTTLILGMLIILKQVDFMQNKKLGFESDQIIATRMFNHDEIRPRWREVKARFLQYPNVVDVSATSTHPGMWAEYWKIQPEGKDSWRVYGLAIDADFLDMFGVSLLEGVNVSAKDPLEDSHEFLLNESAVRVLGWEGQAIGKQLALEGVKPPMSGTVVGVVADFHSHSLHSKIEPMILCKYPSLFRSCSFKIRGDQVQETLAFIQETWESLLPNQPYSATFLDAALDNMYRKERQTGLVFQFLSAIAVFVACLGIVGLSAYVAQRRKKEIGVRKVLGASAIGIGLLLLKELIVLIAIANVIAWPITYYSMGNWLQNFAYRTDIGVETFLTGGFLVLLIALITVGYQTINAALSHRLMCCGMSDKQTGSYLRCVMWFRIAGAQLPVTRDVDKNLAGIFRALDFAVAEKVDLLLTPEGSLSGYTPEIDMDATQEALEKVIDRAKAENIALALGTCFIEADGKCYNQIRFYEKDGTYLGFHSKTLTCGSLTDPPKGEINHYAVKELETFTIKGVKIGGLICNDLWANPGCTPGPDTHLTHQLVTMGAQVIVHAVNGGRDGSDFAHDVIWPYHQSNLQLRARASKVWIVTADSSHPVDIPCSAPSGVVSPNGHWVAKAADRGEQFYAHSIAFED